MAQENNIGFLELTNEQLEQIHELSGKAVPKRNDLLTEICKILGNGWYMTPWCGGCSYALTNDTKGLLVSIETYRLKNPTSYSLKALIDGSSMYYFDKYGNLIDTY